MEEPVPVPRKRGRPPIPVTEEILERRRLSRQNRNAMRRAVTVEGPAKKRGRRKEAEVSLEGSTSSGALHGDSATKEGVCAPKKRGRPRVPLTLEVLEQRRISRQVRNGRRRTAAMLNDPTMNTGDEHGDHAQPSHATGIRTALSTRKRRRKEQRKEEFVQNNTVLDIGSQDQICGCCQAQVWAAEFTGRHTGTGPKGYSLCCGKGKVQLPFLRETPPELSELLTATGQRGVMFHRNARIYNNMFAFCSFGGEVDDSVNRGGAPYAFRVTGQIYHNFGSLVQPPGRTPKFAQLYMYDGQQAIEHRLNFPRNTDSLDVNVVTTLQQMFTRDNILVRLFRQVRERFHDVDITPCHARLLERRATDGRYVNTPTQNDFEFAGLVVDNDFVNHRDIVVHNERLGLQRISELHPSYMPLQYPLLFPYGEDGYRKNIMHRNRDGLQQKNNTVSMREYYAFRNQDRHSEGHTLMRGGRVFLQFLVDAWCSVESGRLRWVRKHQSIIRSDLYNNVVDSLMRGDVVSADIGKRIILPSSFTGGYRYMQQNFQDSLAVCKEYGHPDLFITFTCNPKWEEIQRSVRASGSYGPSVRPDIIARVFKMKLDAMISDFTKSSLLGRVLAVVYTVEFQKRGLPHVHIVLWLADEDKLITPEQIDGLICAEIPDREIDPIGYKAVSQFMMHGPCGAANPKCPCMSNDRCTKQFPKAFIQNTVIGEDGYALYRRRDSKTTVECNKIHLDNRFVVPYHRGLLVKYQGHINVEWCNRSLAIKYLFKYIGKGPDTATVVLEREAQTAANNDNGSAVVTSRNADEVANYLSCRYVSSAEACWRLFEFPIHHREPFVQRLFFHLENQQEVRFRDNETLPEVVRRVDPDGTMFIQWLINNRYAEEGRHLTFVKYPTMFRWESSAKRWLRRQRNMDVIGRLVYAHPASGERFYMRLLLNFVAGAQSFEDIRTVDGVVYSTYKEACFQRGLLDSDKEWHLALDDAAVSGSPGQLRDLFVTLLVFCEVTNPQDLWDAHWSDLSEDIEYKQRKVLKMPTLIMDEQDRKNLALQAINDLLKQYGKSLVDYPGLPPVNLVATSKYTNELLIEEMMYDRPSLKLRAKKGVESLNHMQKTVFDAIVHSVDSGSGGMYFVYGPGGTGKTFLWSTIISHLRSEGKIVLAVASSGIASLLIEGGRTAHSRFRIPIDINEFSSCEMKKNTHLAELICQTSLIVWDEAPMNHRFVFEAVDRTFRDIRTKVNTHANALPFGGLTMLFGGDFRQILPVLPKQGRQEIVAASISKSDIWQYCTVFELCENMRINRNVPPITVDGIQTSFREWVLALGDGSVQTLNLDDDIEAAWIKIPDEMQVNYEGDPVEAIVDEIYDDLGLMHGDMEYLRDRAVLTPLNEYVHSVNNEVMRRLPGESKVYTSCDSICKGSSAGGGDEVLYPTEFLNSLRFSGMPNHELELKVGAPIMLLRNLNPKKGLCNGTRLLVIRCYPFLIEGLIITGNKIGDTTYIPRISMSPADKKFPFILKRKQFPVSVCYAMTINKSQGQTLQNVGLYLPEPVFSHGHLYVAVSRVTTPTGLRILAEHQEGKYEGYTKNIVYREIFKDIL